MLFSGAVAAASSPSPQVVASVSDLISAVRTAAATPGAVIQLAPGDYHLSPVPYPDPTCGNCQDPATEVPATLGLRVSATGLLLRGSGAERTRIVTHAGYGLLFEDCADCRLEDLTVTGGERDTSGLASDAAIVVRRSALTIARCRIAENTGDSATVARTVVGIMGICGREGSMIDLLDCTIERNSWDGVALYRDAYARIQNCVIDGIDRGAQGPACGGRGVAIGVTWNARADITGNLVRRYWKGIGVFVDGEARVIDNVVEDVLTWGITLWDADRGRPYGEIAWNAVSGTGACGISITRGLAGGRTGSAVQHNAIADTGRNPKYDSGEVYCDQRALAVHAATPDIEISENLCVGNREPGNAPGGADLPEEVFREAVQPLIERLAQRPATAQSDFVKRFSVSHGR